MQMKYDRSPNQMSNHKHERKAALANRYNARQRHRKGREGEGVYRLPKPQGNFQLK